MQHVYSDEQYDYVLLGGEYSRGAIRQGYAIVGAQSLTLRDVRFTFGAGRQGESSEITISHADIGRLLELCEAYQQRRQAVASTQELAEG